VLVVSLALLLLLISSSIPENLRVAAGQAAPVSTSGGIAPFFTPEVQYWSTQIVTWAEEHSLDPNLVATVMQIESCGDPFARSSAGAMGLFQVMPFHFRENENTFDPATNALRGLAYLRSSWNQNQGDVKRTLAGYNGGIATSQRLALTWPAETKRYVGWGEPIYLDAVNGRNESKTLNDWLNAGGSGLCRQANERLGIGK
jgi:soluble lytic murein transglycosylase-like protein